MEPSKVHLRLEDTTQCAAKNTWELMQKKKGKSVPEDQCASASSSGWELENEVLDRTGNRKMLLNPNA